MNSTPAREKELRSKFDSLRMQAPNPRDFPNWDAFYAAQASHENELGEIETEIDRLVQEAWA